MKQVMVMVVSLSVLRRHFEPRRSVPWVDLLGNSLAGHARRKDFAHSRRTCSRDRNQVMNGTDWRLSNGAEVEAGVILVSLI
jgi:hypothetical protein